MKIRRIASCILICILLAATLLPEPILATTLQEDLIRKQQLEAQIESLKRSRADVQAALQQAINEKNDCVKILDLIYDEIDTYQAEMNAISLLVVEYRYIISQKEKEIARLDEELQKDLDQFRKKLEYAQETGDTGYIDFILGATDLSDILTRSEIISDMLEYDRELIKSISEAKKDVENSKAEVQNTLDLCNAKVSEYTAILQKQEEKKKEAEEYLAEASNDVDAQYAMQQRVAQSQYDLEKELSDLITLINQKSEKPFDGTFIWPLPLYYPGYITQYFNTSNPNLTRHTGLDIGVGGWGNNGKIPALAAATGTVVRIGYWDDWGNLVVLDHGGGYQTYYAHLNAFSVEFGQVITQGQQVGFIGSTGHSDGPHLHIVVEVNGVRQDPLLYISYPS